MKVLGIDPGTQGALAVLDGVEVVHLDDLPVHMLGVAGKKTTRAELDLHGLRAVLALHAPFDHAFIEKVGPMPKQGVVGVWRFGMAFGAILGIVCALDIPLSLVPPKVWQKAAGIGPAPDAARQRAMQLFPASAVHLARKKDHHRADALLLARFGATAEAPRLAA